MLLRMIITFVQLKSLAFVPGLSEKRAKGIRLVNMLYFRGSVTT